MKRLALCLLLAACSGEVAQTATCTQVGSTYIYGHGTLIRYECDSDPGEGCELNAAGEYQCPAGLKQAHVICPEVLP